MLLHIPAMALAFGKTIGKFALFIRIVDANGDEPSIMQVLGRTFFGLLEVNRRHCRRADRVFLQAPTAPGRYGREHLCVARCGSNRCGSNRCAHPVTGFPKQIPSVSGGNDPLSPRISINIPTRRPIRCRIASFEAGVPATSHQSLCSVRCHDGGPVRPCAPGWGRLTGRRQEG